MNILYCRHFEGEFKKAQGYSNYEDAVQAGQELVGYGNFYIETGVRVPSREEQLLLPQSKPTPKTKSKKQKLLDLI